MRIGSISGYNPYSAYGSYDFGDVFKTAAAANAGKDGDAGKVSADPAHQVAPGRKSSPAECETCRTRKYQDGSDEMVSFKSASHISPEAAPAAVRGHEGEHVSNAYKKASEKGGKVLQASVAIHTSICPECGRSYVSGGTTTTKISYPGEEKSKYQQERKALQRDALVGANFDKKV